ncbi:hypothetical protein CDES_10500 [Corynebacterium deserti GIMN1.010]|uniref:Uncharacterized protein n=1 Tax=Corynebacterium deserti GIMN1.010 TaxID=931089 RepID=A0A0M4CKI2_9CORY|nr:hypothetical protein [Corynebacterium deserti]ALC06476.1 hypothetical protein CDES_10500 [Corynebacterium deserti GIMN1.010]
MKAVKVRTGVAALMRSKAMWTCVLFVLVCLPFLLFFLVEWNDSEGTMRTLYGIAAALPGLGLVAAVASMCVVWWRRRQAVLVIDDHVKIPRTGVSFALSDLDTVQLWSDAGARSHVALLPRHVGERVNTSGVASIEPYMVTFPSGADPQPFELAEMLVERKPDIAVERLGRL